MAASTLPSKPSNRSRQTKRDKEDPGGRGGGKTGQEVNGSKDSKETKEGAKARAQRRAAVGVLAKRSAAASGGLAGAGKTGEAKPNEPASEAGKREKSEEGAAKKDVKGTKAKTAEDIRTLLKSFSLNGSSSFATPTTKITVTPDPTKDSKAEPLSTAVAKEEQQAATPSQVHVTPPSTPTPRNVSSSAILTVPAKEPASAPTATASYASIVQANLRASLATSKAEVDGGKKKEYVPVPIGAERSLSARAAPWTGRAWGASTIPTVAGGEKNQVGKGGGGPPEAKGLELVRGIWGAAGGTVEVGSGKSETDKHKDIWSQAEAVWGTSSDGSSIWHSAPPIKPTNPLISTPTTSPSTPHDLPHDFGFSRMFVEPGFGGFRALNPSYGRQVETLSSLPLSRRTFEALSKPESAWDPARLERPTGLPGLWSTDYSDRGGSTPRPIWPQSQSLPQRRVPSANGMAVGAGVNPVLGVVVPTRGRAVVGGGAGSGSEDGGSGVAGGAGMGLLPAVWPTSAPPPPGTFVPGDWNCTQPLCGYHNFQRNTECRACGHPRAWDQCPRAPPNPRPLGSFGDWKCECGYTNWSRRAICRKCFPTHPTNQDRPSDKSPASQHSHAEIGIIPINSSPESTHQMVPPPRMLNAHQAASIGVLFDAANGEGYGYHQGMQRWEGRHGVVGA
ncbi:hypothetical protein IAT38_000722 [Cryptococcus sp. DSM 104549]